jgi:hypothetical protein
MLFFALLSSRESLAANMPQLVAIVGFAVLRIVAAARGGVVAMANVVFRLGLILLLGGVVVDERPRPLSLPGRPGVSKLVRCQERQLVLPVDSVSEIKIFFNTDKSAVIDIANGFRIFLDDSKCRLLLDL